MGMAPLITKRPNQAMPFRQAQGSELADGVANRWSRRIPGFDDFHI